jgi:hypothetical protein
MALFFFLIRCSAEKEKRKKRRERREGKEEKRKKRRERRERREGKEEKRREEKIKTPATLPFIFGCVFIIFVCCVLSFIK